MNEYECQDPVRTAGEACAGWRELVRRLRLGLPAKAVALAAAVRAEWQDLLLSR